MNRLDVRADLYAEPWTHLEGRNFAQGLITHVGLWPDGIREGRSMLGLTIDLNGLGVVMGECSLRLMSFAVRQLLNSTAVIGEKE